MPRSTRESRIARRVSQWIKGSHNGSVRAAARAVEVDHVTLWRVSKGHFTKTPFDTLRRIADATHTDVAEWLGDDTRSNGA